MRGRKATAPTQRTLQNHHRKKLPELSDVTICNHVSQSNSARQRPFLSPPTTIRADALGQLSRVEDVYVHGSMQATTPGVHHWWTPPGEPSGVVPREGAGVHQGVHPLVDPSPVSPQASFPRSGDPILDAHVRQLLSAVPTPARA